jgi:hypothetical protein
MPATPRRFPMTNVDKAWLEMDSATNLMIINGVMLFKDQLDFEVLKRTLAERFVGKYERFRQRVVTGPGGQLYWEDDPRRSRPRAPLCAALSGQHSDAANGRKRHRQRAARPQQAAVALFAYRERGGWLCHHSAYASLHR